MDSQLSVNTPTSARMQSQHTFDAECGCARSDGIERILNLHQFTTGAERGQRKGVVRFTHLASIAALRYKPQFVSRCEISFPISSKPTRAHTPDKDVDPHCSDGNDFRQLLRPKQSRWMLRVCWNANPESYLILLTAQFGRRRSGSNLSPCTR